MLRSLTLFAALCGLVLYSACQGSKRVQNSTQQSPRLAEQPVNGDICPDCARFAGRLVEIVADKTNACNTGPCLGLVQILEVKAIGRSFGAALDANSQVQIRFPKGFAGLAVGDSFIAQVTTQETPNSNQPTIVIADYQKQ